MEKEKIRYFRKVLRAFEREVLLQNNSNSCGGVTISQCHALLEIEKLNETTVGDLAKSIALDKSTVSRTIEGLVNIGLVDRSIPSHNRRSSQIKLTGQGKQICQQINDNNDQYFEEALSVISSTELDSFLKNFDKVTNNMKNVNGKLYEHK